MHMTQQCDYWLLVWDVPRYLPQLGSKSPHLYVLPIRTQQCPEPRPRVPLSTTIFAVVEGISPATPGEVVSVISLVKDRKKARSGQLRKQSSGNLSQESHLLLPQCHKYHNETAALPVIVGTCDGHLHPES